MQSFMSIPPVVPEAPRYQPPPPIQSLQPITAQPSPIPQAPVIHQTIHHNYNNPGPGMGFGGGGYYNGQDGLLDQGYYRNGTRRPPLNLKRHPQYIQCPHCHLQITTSIEHRKVQEGSCCEGGSLKQYFYKF